MKTVFITLLLMTLIAFGCKQRTLSHDQYAQWVESPDNGLSSSKELGDYSFSLFYQPHDYLALLRLRNTEFSMDSIKSIDRQLGDMQYYKFRIKGKSGSEIMREGTSGDDEYYARLEYFVGPMQDDISLIDGKDTLPCLLFHFERNYGLAPYNDFLLGFSGSNSAEENKTLLFDDQVFGSGPVLLTISGSDISDIPTLTNE